MVAALKDVAVALAIAWVVLVVIFFAAFELGRGNSAHALECMQHKPGEPSLARKMIEQGYTKTAGGPLKGDAADVLPRETTAMLMVHPETRMWSVLVTTPKAVTCEYLRGTSWIEGPSQ